MYSPYFSWTILQVVTSWDAKERWFNLCKEASYIISKSIIPISIIVSIVDFAKRIVLFDVPVVIGWWRQLHHAKVQWAACYLESIKKQLPFVVAIWRFGRCKGSLTVTECRGVIVYCDIVGSIDDFTLRSNKLQSDGAGVYPFYPEAVGICCFQHRDAVVTCVRKPNVSRSSGWHRHFRCNCRT